MPVYCRPVDPSQVTAAVGQRDHLLTQMSQPKALNVRPRQRQGAVERGVDDELELP